MKLKILSFVLAALVWQLCLEAGVVLASISEGLSLSDVDWRAFVPYVLFSVLLGACVALAGSRFSQTGTAVTGIAIGVLPSVIGFASGVVTLRGIEAWAALWLAISGCVGGALSGLMSWQIQKRQR